MNVYENLIKELKDNLKLILCLNKNISEVKSIFRQYRFTKVTIFYDGYITQLFTNVNSQLKYITNNKIFKLLLPDIYRQMNTINFNLPFPDNYEYVCGLLIVNCNYKLKALDIFNKIINTSEYENNKNL